MDIRLFLRHCHPDIKSEGWAVRVFLPIVEKQLDGYAFQEWWESPTTKFGA